MSSALRTAFPVHKDFGMFCLHMYCFRVFFDLFFAFFVDPLVANSRLFNLHVFFFPVFCYWFLVLYPCAKDASCDFSLSKFWDLFSYFTFDLSWRMFHVHLKTMCILLFLDAVSYIYIKFILSNVFFKAYVSLVKWSRSVVSDS